MSRRRLVGLSAADVAYVGDGGDIPALARKHNVSASTIYRRIRELGINLQPAPARGPRGPARDAERRAKVLAAVEAHGGQRAAARALGLSAARVNQIVRDDRRTKEETT